MFDVDVESEDSASKPELKKIKLNEIGDSKPVHSSLTYSSLRAPPLVEYKSIDGYCESKLGTSLVPSPDELSAPSTSGINSLQNISSPIVFKSPKTQSEKTILPANLSKPYGFFSVEELSLVKCLKNWTNTKVCPVGLVSYDKNTQLCYLDSVMEKGHWRLLLDTSLITEIPDLQKLLQIFGTLEVKNSAPVLKVHFYRNLGSVNLPLFVESYKLMQKYIPEFVKEDKKSLGLEEREEVDIKENADTTVHKLNDTLDDYDFSLIM